MMTRSQSVVLQADAEDANNSNLTQEEPSQEDQTQQPLNLSQIDPINEEGPPSSHHTPIHTPPHHSAAILHQTPAIFSPRAYSPSVPHALSLDPTSRMTQALLLLMEELRQHDTSAPTWQHLQNEQK